MVLLSSDVGMREDARSSVGPVRMALDHSDFSADRRIAALDVADPITANAAIPYADVPIEEALGVNLLSARYDEVAKGSALECLTAAIYYEAGYEPMQGLRAVAQVVLNRVRHPLFPNSVCGVVYQGSERRTGCQFTFTCDGSLARPAPPAAWEKARLVAKQSLSGGVEPSVGMATHYHANYVVPYWAPSLDKIATVGSHIFYKWKGTLGRRVAFSQIPVADNMVSTPSIPDIAQFDQLLEQSVPARIVAPSAMEPVPQPLREGPAPKADSKAGSPLVVDREIGRLVADEKAGTLLLDGQ